MRCGVMALARPTFDVAYAEQVAEQAFCTIEAAGVVLIGERKLLFDATAAMGARHQLAKQTLDALLLLQISFTDSVITVDVAEVMKLPLILWAFPEPRVGGRLRLNAFCGLNLAMHALGRAGVDAAWMYMPPDEPEAATTLISLVEGRQAGLGTRSGYNQQVWQPVAGPSAEPAVDPTQVDGILARLVGAQIGVIGEHPSGFDTCRYDASTLAQIKGAGATEISLHGFLDRIRAIPLERRANTRAEVAHSIAGLDEVDPGQLDLSLAVSSALSDVARETGAVALAVRCWPEMFTELGCAACGPMGLVTGAGIPCACEADVLGALTMVLLQAAASEPAWLVDVVDMDTVSDTSVFWHCGSAPLFMADPATPPQAQIHSNRKMPLLAEFALRPGRITVIRLSQSRNSLKLVLAGAEVLSAPMSFTGTSGVVRFDRSVDEVMATILGEGLEHHLALAYGEHRPVLRAVANALNLPVMEMA